MPDGFSTTTSDLVLARDGVACWACGMRSTERHHRRRRQVDHDGLAHSAANCLRFCGWGNHTGCHGLVHSRPTWAETKGYIVIPDASPLEVPVWHYSRGWVLLDITGGWTATTNGD